MPAIPMEHLKAALTAERLQSYVRLRGGYPIPLAGAVYWLVLAAAGARVELGQWIALAVWGSGAIFPLALLLAKLLKCDFMRDRTSIDDVLVPTFASMLLFWPMLAAAIWTEPQLAVLILAIGMSLHWPVIGWSYGRTGLFTAHAIVRAALALFLWVSFPAERLTLVPLSVALLYLATVAAILIDSACLRRRFAEGGE